MVEGVGESAVHASYWTALRATWQLEPACLMLAWPTGRARHLILLQAHVMKGVAAKRSCDQWLGMLCRVCSTPGPAAGPPPTAMWASCCRPRAGPSRPCPSGARQAPCHARQSTCCMFSQRNRNLPADFRKLVCSMDHGAAIMVLRGYLSALLDWLHPAEVAKYRSLFAVVPIKSRALVSFGCNHQ